MDRICNNCKAKLPSDSEFCQYCGAPVNKEKNIDNDYVIHNEDENRKPFMGGILVVFAVLAISIVVIWMESKNIDVNRKDNRTTNSVKDNSIETTEKFSYEEMGLTFNQYKVTKIIASDVQSYCEYMVELNEILIKGTYDIDVKKEKATEYINNLPLDYGQRIIMFRIMFPNDTTYCNDIVEYLNEREDISYEDTVFILEELGFAVFEDGTVKW